MSKDDRIAALSEALNMAADARQMATTPVWDQMWARLEREYLERLLKCGPTDDLERYRLQIAIEVSRKARNTIEHAGKTVPSLEAEIAVLEGRKLAPVA